jgi:hypothetical protein
MIAEYMDSLVAYGASFYRNLFWEAGLVGQLLYLEGRLDSTGWLDALFKELLNTLSPEESETSDCGRAFLKS